MSIKVRDTRRPGWFWIDNELLDIYGPNIGAYGLAVYMALGRVSRNGECKTTVRQIAAMLDVSPQTAMRALDKLIESGLVCLEKKSDGDGPSIYFLCEVPKHPVPIGNRPVPEVVQPCSSGDTDPVPIGNTIKTNTKTENTNTSIPVIFELTPVELKDLKRPTQKEKQAKEKFSIPDWLPIPEWQGWLEMRKSMRKPATPLAQKYAIEELDVLRTSGENIREVIRKAISKNWLAFYPVNGNGHTPPPMDALERERQKEANRRKV